MINELLKSLSIEILDSDKIASVLGNPKEYPTKLIEDLSLETASKFYKKEISYLEGDYIMNNLYSFWTSNLYFFKNYSFSEVASECYEAFDAGEYYRSTDDPKLDPVNIYSKPLIEKLLKKRYKL